MPWEVMPDLFFYRDPEEAEKEELAREEAAVVAKQADFQASPAKEEWGGEELGGGAAGAPVNGWAADGTAPGAAPAAPAAPIAAPAPAALQVIRPLGWLVAESLQTGTQKSL